MPENWLPVSVKLVQKPWQIVNGSDNSFSGQHLLCRALREELTVLTPYTYRDRVYSSHRPAPTSAKSSSSLSTDLLYHCKNGCPKQENLGEDKKEDKVSGGLHFLFPFFQTSSYLLPHFSGTGLFRISFWDNTNTQGSTILIMILLNNFWATSWDQGCSFITLCLQAISSLLGLSRPCAFNVDTISLSHLSLLRHHTCIQRVGMKF